MLMVAKVEARNRTVVRRVIRKRKEGEKARDGCLVAHATFMFGSWSWQVCISTPQHRSLFLSPHYINRAADDILFSETPEQNICMPIVARPFCYP